MDSPATYYVQCDNCDAVSDTVTVAVGEALTAVAKVGEKKYATLAKAVAEADGKTIVILQDIDLAAAIEVSNITFTLDLAGHTITADWVDPNGVVEVLWAKEGANVTITGNGKMIGGSEECSFPNVISATDNASVIIKNGTFTSGCSVIYATRGGSVAIEDGWFEATADYEGRYYVLDVNEAEAVLGIITVSGGKFVNFDPANHTTDGDYSNKVVEGYHSIGNAGVYTVSAHAYAENGYCACGAEDPNAAFVAQVGQKKYLSLTAAYAAAKDNDTITLLVDASGAGIVIDKDITIDFAGKTYTFTTPAVGSKGTTTNGFQILKNNEVTLKNGTLKVAEEYKDDYYILVQNYANLKVINMTLDGTNLDKYAFSDQDSYTLSVSNGTAVVENTTIIANNDGDLAYALDSFDSTLYTGVPTVTLKGESKIDGNIEVTGGNMALEAGTVTGKLVYTSGTVTKDAVVIDAPADYKWDENGTLVAKNYVAAINGTAKYETLSEALAEAKDGDVVTLLANATIETNTTLAAGVTYEIPAGLTLTVAEGVTVDAADTATLNCAGTIVVAGKADISNLKYDDTFGKCGGNLTITATGEVVMLNEWATVWSPITDAQLGGMLLDCETGAKATCGTNNWTLAAEGWKHDEHSYTSEQTKDPTCTEAGETTYTCTAPGCGHSYTEEVPATGHQNTEIRDAKEATTEEEGYTGDTWCTDCNTKIKDGEVIEKKEPTVANATLNVYLARTRLKDLLNLAFFFNMTTEEEVIEVGALVWTDKDATRVPYKAKAGNGYYSVEVDGVFAQEIDTRVYIIPYVQTVNGYAYGQEKSTSVLSCMEYMYGSKDETAATKAVIKDLLNYANAAREYFVAKGTMTAPSKAFNSVLSEADRELAWSDEYRGTVATVQETTGEFAPTHMTVVCGIQEALRLRFESKDANVSGFVYWTEEDYVATNEHTKETATGEMEFVRTETVAKGYITGIYSYEMYDNFFVRAYNAEGKLTKTYTRSVAAYLTYDLDKYASSDKAEDQAYVELCKAMLIYGYTAKNSDAITKG